MAIQAKGNFTFLVPYGLDVSVLNNFQANKYFHVPLMRRDPLEHSHA